MTNAGLEGVSVSFEGDNLLIWNVTIIGPVSICQRNFSRSLLLYIFIMISIYCKINSKTSYIKIIYSYLIFQSDTYCSDQYRLIHHMLEENSLWRLTLQITIHLKHQRYSIFYDLNTFWSLFVTHRSLLRLKSTTQTLSKILEKSVLKLSKTTGSQH